MAITAATVKARIVTTIKAIVLPDPGERFSVAHEGESLDERASVSGANREFHVWFAAGEIGEVVHPTESMVREQLVVAVLYAGQADFQAQDDEIRADVQRIRAAIDNHDNWGTDVVHQHVQKWQQPQPRLDVGNRVLTVVVQVDFFESNS